MTRFWRDGHYRSTVHGTYYVSGHWVERDDWDRFSGGQFISNRLPMPRTNKSTYIRARSKFAPFSWAVPNAYCPVCGAEVFYYQNENGSRVFFDALGPPWPKHPCTDNQKIDVRYYTLPDDNSNHLAIKGWVGSASIRQGWMPYEIIDVKTRGRPFLTLERMSLEPRIKIRGWVTPSVKPVLNTIAFLKEEKLWFVEKEELRPVECDFEQQQEQQKSNKKRKKKKKKK